MPEEAINLIALMLSINPKERPTASECMTNVFFMAPKEPMR